MKKNRPHVSVIVIDFKINNPLLVECLSGINKQTYTNFEVILLTDYRVNIKFPRLKKRYYGRYIGPAIKRDDGAKIARGEILVFIDDDAYPADKNWLKEMVQPFSNPKVAAVGGPGVTPPSVPWQEQLAGWFSASPIGGGPCTYRFIPAKMMEVDDYPSMNLAVRKSDFLKVGGFDSNYWPGEDTKLCLELVYKLKKKIIYNPDAVVYHHRRPLFWPHFKQNGNYGIHRGYFARALPKTSFRLEYFGPSLVFLGLLYLLIYQILGSAVGLNRLAELRFIYKFGLITTLGYGIAVVLNGLWIAKMSGNFKFGVLSIPLTIATVLWYGVKFIQGFLSPGKIENSNQRRSA
ncbi:MAG: Glycosyl transferase family 2 [Microgenomates group bacterium GW2011_GWA2_44_7]|nr:MAG: Glycosyl transferase family 2 [Microgenomates group bacterium GW2011_GWA2_44_7]KKT78398.1 MAG: Glycosyl transferase family 2 [Microgenomates group bacterium GW2011_GWB1_44_8]